MNQTFLMLISSTYFICYSSYANESAVINVSSPCCTCSSNNMSFVLVSNVFNGVGFISYKRSMIILIFVGNKLDFVDIVLISWS